MKSTVEQEEPDQSTDTSKILSICMFGRDDNYTPDFRYRITTTINHIVWNLKQLDRLDDVEILVTDWGSHIPMAQTLTLSQESARITRFIYVPIEVIRATQDGRENFHTSRAPNVAIRRASGTYILVYSADTLIPQYSLESLLRFLKEEIPIGIELERTFFLLPRLDVPWQFLERQPNLEEWDRYLLLNTKNTPLEPTPMFGFFGSTGALMMHRSMWHTLRGLNERYAGYGTTDIELGFRVSQNYPVLSLSSIGIILYHMGHPPGHREPNVNKKYINYYNTTLQVNNENWGLYDIDLDLQIPVPKYNIIGEKELITKKKDTALIESWPQTNKEIFSELNNSDICQHVKSVIASFHKRQWKIKLEELNALFLISWYSHYHYPRQYLEIAVGMSPAAGVVASACPSVEIYKLDIWDRTSPPSSIPIDLSPFELSFIYEVSSYRGCLRFINGDIGTSVQRLQDSFIGTFTFDLVWVKDDLLREDVVVYVGNLLFHLATGGALIFTSSSADLFITEWRAIQTHYPCFTYISCADNKTGMILAASLKDNGQQSSPIVGISFDTSPLESLRIKMWILNKIMNILLNKKIRKVIRKIFGGALPYETLKEL